ncbi:MAG: protein translocase subunit SecD, partial [Bacteroidales bacterium]|nr:protein translocase subunit SecD [Bacteroidales bacterium]
MQSKGAITLVAILIGLACLFQLSFTAATTIQESKAAKAAAKVVEEVQQSPSFAEVSEFNRAFYLDSVTSAANKQYLDSIANKKVYFNYTYKNVKEKELNLGLDLKGGMNIVLQLDLAELVRSCAREKTTEEFNQAMALAAERADQTHEDFISLFAQAWDEVAPGKRLSFDIDLDKLSGDVKNKSRATNEEIISLLKEEAKSAIDNSYQVVERRVNQFGVAQPNIQKVAGTGRILVELPGVKEPERVRKLLQGTASLEFWETYTSQELQPYLQELNETVRMQLEALEGTEADEQPAVEQPKAASDTSSLEAELAASADENNDANRELLMKANPLFSRLQLMGGNSALLGIAHYRDTAQINAWINANRTLFPGDFVPAWSFKAFDGDGVQPDTYFELVALKSHVGKGPALDGKYISSANVNYNQMTGAPEVSMAMNSKGAIEWENITGENVGRQIAIVMDGQVYSYPNVQNKISGGNSSISGNFTQTDADDLANVLKSGKLSTPARIVQEQVVGPSLGSESIRHGLISFVIAFILVLIYMIIFYRKAGVAADIALLCNVLFLFGALASFGTVFTLSGIAGLVLTMGMAVDANVIIYERIKEELNAGKALRLAISDGYKNAYSAILDGQITTILTGIILYLFGSGTIKGFAAVLVIGIITSVFTSIFITRLIFEARLKRNKDITFASEWSSRFLKNTHIDFLGMRKKTYLISGIVCLICLAFIFTKGFSLGVDFSGGRTYTVRFDQPVTPEQVRAALLDEFHESSEVKQFGGTSQMRITTKYMVNDKSDATDRLIEGKLFNALKGFYANPVTLEGFTSTLENPNGIISSDRVDASIASEVRRDAVIAVILALIVIFGYIAFRFKNWSWGVGGVSSLIHNSIIVIG